MKWYGWNWIEMEKKTERKEMKLKGAIRLNSFIDSDQGFFFHLWILGIPFELNWKMVHGL